MNVVERIGRGVVRRGYGAWQSAARRKELKEEERAHLAQARRDRTRPRLFNLDLHIGVIGDLETELRAQGADLVRWSISGHNHLLRGRRPVPDPVQHVNARSWKRLDADRIARFQDRYGEFLRTFDGFVVTHTPSFAQLYGGFGRPTLVVVSTRYEAPYTAHPAAWRRLDSFLELGVSNGSIIGIANNRGDSDYFHFLTGIDLPVVPSVCDKPGNLWNGGNETRVIFCRDDSLAQEFSVLTNGLFQPISVLGRPYSWDDLLECEEVLVLPQNISTMTLFELATAGIPVVVPSRSWMKELAASHRTVLGELTYTQLQSIDTRYMSGADPRNWSSPAYLDWWLDRADFYDSHLMPNVRVAESPKDLLVPSAASRRCVSEYLEEVLARNDRLRASRASAIRRFLERL